MTDHTNKPTAAASLPCPICGDTDGLWCSLPGCPNTSGHSREKAFAGDFEHSMSRIVHHFNLALDARSIDGAALLKEFYAAMETLRRLKTRAEFELITEVRVAGHV